MAEPSVIEKFKNSNLVLVRISYNTYHCFDFSKWENELEQTGKIKIENKSY